jgi:hypothetical protein
MPEFRAGLNHFLSALEKSPLSTGCRKLDELLGGVRSGLFYLVYGDGDIVEELLSHILVEALKPHGEDEGATKAAYMLCGNYRVEKTLLDAQLIMGLLEAAGIDPEDGLRRIYVLPAFRMDIDLLIVKSLPTNPYDYDLIRRFIGPEGVEFLIEVEQERVDSPIFLGYGVWWHRGEIGVWYNPRYEGPDPFEDLEETLSLEAAYSRPPPPPGSDECFEAYAVRRATEDYPPEKAKALKLRIIDGLTLDAIGELLTPPREHNTVSDWLREMGESRMGYYFEDYFCHLIGVKSNSDKTRPIPDCIAPDGTIYSLKCYMTARASPSTPRKSVNLR